MCCQQNFCLQQFWKQFEKNISRPWIDLKIFLYVLNLLNFISGKFCIKMCYRFLPVNFAIQVKISEIFCQFQFLVYFVVYLINMRNWLFENIYMCVIITKVVMLCWCVIYKYFGKNKYLYMKFKGMLLLPLWYFSWVLCLYKRLSYRIGLLLCNCEYFVHYVLVQ